MSAVNADLFQSICFQRVALAQGALAAGDQDRAETLLEEECPPSLRGWEWHCLRGTRPGSPFILRGNPPSPVPVAFSPDGKRLGTASMDQTVKVWDLVGLDQRPGPSQPPGP